MNGIACALIGRLPKDADALKYTAQGTALVSFSVAVQDTKRGQDDPTERARITCWGELGESLDGALGKGTEVYVEGRLQVGEWTAKDGTRRSELNVSAWTVQPLGRIGRRVPKRNSAVARAARDRPERVPEPSVLLVPRGRLARALARQRRRLAVRGVPPAGRRQRSGMMNLRVPADAGRVGDERR